MTVRRTAANLFRTVSDAVRSVVAPAALVRSSAPAAPVTDPADVYTDADMPAAEDIAAAAVQYAAAADLARAGDRGKRAAKKVLGRLPAGRYGAWVVERVASARQTPDLEAIRATYKRLELGPVPMRDTAPSLRVSKAPADLADIGPAADAHMTALAAEHPAALVAA
ncbi:hypothetical protein AB0C97_36850 [Streptomyces goshikiensis]|uniref:hypothetical protein n=1 Tax=Streptomyces goshikiensis TaxID=1942 RepID=UPI00340CCBE6